MKWDFDMTALKLSAEVKNAMLDSIANSIPIKRIGERTYLTVNKLTMSSKGVSLYFDKMLVMTLPFNLNIDINTDTLILEGVEALFNIAFD